jgi:hypothetical protein
MSTVLYPEADYESDFEFDPEDYGEFDPEAPAPSSRGRGGYRTPQQPRPGSGGGYTRPSATTTAVTQEQLRQALVRVKQDIDRVANGVRANTAGLNDLAGRTTRNFTRLRNEKNRDVARLEREVAGARELSVLGAVLAGGTGSNVLLPMIVLSMDQQATTQDGQGGGGLLGGSNNTTMLLALAVSGALKP